MHDPCTYSCSCSSHTTASSHSTRRPARRSRRRRRIHSLPLDSSSPSSALLSILATLVASSSSVSAVPAPLPFLCPGIDSESYYDNHSKLPSDCLLALTQRSKPDSPRLTHHSTHERRRIPDKYSQGDDGVWRRTSYTLYGSTMCAGCSDPTPYVPSAQDSTDQAISPVATSTSLDDFLNTLPAGWRPVERTDRTALILAISLVLAFFICFFIIGCILWRKGLRRARDIERTAKKSKTVVEDDLTAMVEKELKAKRKVWARASARWRANAHFSARLRRGKRRPVQVLDGSARNSIRDHDSDTEASVHVTPSHSTSRRSSINSTRSSISVSSTPALEAPSSPPPPHLGHASLPSSPPAYRRHSLTDLPSVQIQTPSPTPVVSHKFVPEGPTALNSRAQSHRPSHGSADASPPQLDEQEPEELLAYSPTTHSAHVATDDKHVLERMTRLASEPPPNGPLEEGNTSTPHNYIVSAPVWDDEELEELALAESSQMAGISSSCELTTSPADLLYPPPPAPAASGKGKMTGDYYGYEDTFGARYIYDSYAYEQHSLALEPEAEPSAPPFEPSDADTSDSHCPGPSAPPFELDDLASDEVANVSTPPPNFDGENATSETTLHPLPSTSLSPGPEGIPRPGLQNHDRTKTPSSEGSPPTPP